MNGLKSNVFCIMLLVAVAIFVAGCTILEISGNVKENVMFVMTFVGLLIGIVGILVALWVDTKNKKWKEFHEIDGFVKLHNEMTSEMKKILDYVGDEKKHLHILSFTPAFGNISAPELYDVEREGSHGGSDGSNVGTYKYLLEKIVEKGNYNVDVRVICYNALKRHEYHSYWAEVIEEEAAKRQKLIDKWESQALHIINIVRREWGDDAVEEVDHMHPILFFSTDDILLQYAIRNDANMKKSVVSGIKLEQKNKVKFFNLSFGEFYNKPSDVCALCDGYLGVGSLFAQSARAVMKILDGEAVERKREVNDLDVLLAYGGGKDSTLVLLFLKYVQELFLRKSRSPFKLHILVHVHPGMGRSVLENIYNVFRKLGLDTDTYVDIAFKSKGMNLDVKKFMNEYFDSGTVLLNSMIKSVFRREVLLLGHLSRGLGRHTFCYTCNLDMVRTIIDYTYDKNGEIDFVVSGDSAGEQESHVRWLNTVFSFINKKTIDIKDRSYGTESFFKDFIKLHNLFESCLGVSAKRRDADKQIGVYPELFKIYKYVDLTLSPEFISLLDRGLEFKFHEESFNFSETDCFYPAVMALMAEMRGEDDCARYLKAHINHVSEIMDSKRFPLHLTDAAKSKYNPNIEDDWKKKIMRYLSDMLDIDEKKLKAVVYSPFIEGGRRLQDFLDANGINLKKNIVIGYIKNENTSLVDYIKGRITVSDDDGKKIEKFLDEWIGLSRDDVKKILNSYKHAEEYELLEKIASGDPYVKDVDVGGGKKIKISGR